MGDYHRFHNERLFRDRNGHESAMWRKGEACPGNIGHAAQMRKATGGKIVALEMFERWHGRSTTAYRLYWRTHPQYAN